VNTDNAVVQNPKLNSVRALLAKMKGQFEMALPKHMSADRLMRVALTACQTNPKLLDCTPTSFAGAMMRAAQVGLEPDGTLGRAYLIPRKNNRAGTLECHFQVGYKGLVELCQRSGEIASVRADVVRKGDFLVYEKGINEKLEHREGVGNWDAPITHVYAIIRTKNGGVYWDCWTAEKVEAHRRRFSKDTREDSAWETSWEEMGEKTVLTAVTKLAPKSVEVAMVTADEARAEAGLPIDIEVVDLTEKADGPPKTIADLKTRAKKDKSQQEEPPPAEEAPATLSATPAVAAAPTASPAASPAQNTGTAKLLELIGVYKEMLAESVFMTILKKHGGDLGMLNLGLGSDGLKALLDELNKATGP
jgi:recombination protein RecT